MHLKESDPQIILELLENERDIITEKAQQREQFYQSQTCPRCGGEALTKIGNIKTLFRRNDPLPRYQLHCEGCECQFDPYSGIILTMGNLAKAYVPAVPLIDGPED